MSMNSADIDIESVQIIKIKETEFVFNYDAVKKIIEDNRTNTPALSEMPVSIIVINGALRTGKSFFINFMIRHLLKVESAKLNESADLTESNTDADTNADTDTHTHNTMLYDYFRSRRGTDSQTLGIWVLNKIFVYRGMAIILMDTQGIFDRQLNQAMTTALICISTLLSSYQIYNLDKRIQEDHLNNMAYFSAYTDLLSGIYDDNDSANSDDLKPKMKVGQTLSLLVRDWQNFEDAFDMESCIREMERYQVEFLFDADSKVKSDTRRKIMNTFDKVNVRLCPHPGHLVTEGVFTGNLSSIRKEFMIHVEYIISDVLSNLEAKRVSPDTYLMYSDVPEFMQRYVDLYRNIKDTLPEPKTILETATKISQSTAKSNVLTKYKSIMMDAVRSKDLTKEEMLKIHNNAKSISMNYYNKIRIIGDKPDLIELRNIINKEISQEYEVFSKIAIDMNMMYVLSKISNTVMNYIMRYISSISSITNLQNLNLAFMLILIIGKFGLYVLSYILPDFMNYVTNYALNTLLWIVIGMIVAKYNMDSQRYRVGASQSQTNNRTTADKNKKRR